LDTVIIIVFSIFLCCKYGAQTAETLSTAVIEQISVKLNPDFIKNEDAFMEVAHALGFN